MSKPARDDPRSEELEKFLRRLKPRNEVVTRCALGQLYEPCRTDAQWGERIKQLLEGMEYDEAGLARMFTEAEEIAARMRKELEQTAL